MKKSLYKISLALVSLIILNCHSNSKSGGKTAKKSEVTTQSSIGSTNGTGNLQKDTLASSVKGTAIIHGNPNQSELDSVKAEKKRKK